MDLVYIDRGDSMDENTDGLASMLREGGLYDTHSDWIADAQYEGAQYIVEEYEKTLEDREDDEDREDENRDMREWLYEMDTSTPEMDLLRNTSNKLFFINTPDGFEKHSHLNEDGNYCDGNNAKTLIKKYARTGEQTKEIQDTCDESFYDAPASFYFSADPSDVYRGLWGEGNEGAKYIQIDGAYFGTVDRSCGSNWLGQNNCFKIVIPRECFLANVYMDEEKGTGYGWGDIAGRSGYDEAGICAVNTKKHGYLKIEGTTSPAQLREKALADKWSREKVCTAGDMNINRHKEKPYSNVYPCGNRCTACGTFWID